MAERGLVNGSRGVVVGFQECGRGEGGFKDSYRDKRYLPQVQVQIGIGTVSIIHQYI
jgi:hypothetical protein